MEIYQTLIIGILVIVLIVILVLFIRKSGTKTKSGDEDQERDQDGQVLTEEEKDATNRIFEIAKSLAVGLAEYEAVKQSLKKLFVGGLSIEDRKVLTLFSGAVKKAASKRPGKALSLSSKLYQKNLRQRSVFARFRSLFNESKVLTEDLLMHGIKSKKLAIEKANREGFTLTEEEANKFSADAIQKAAEKMGVEGVDHEVATKLAERAEKMVVESVDPIGWFLDVSFAGSMVIDYFNVGGWLSSTSTKDWLKQKNDIDEALAMDYIAANKLTGTFWPEIVGPLSVMDSAGTLDFELTRTMMEMLISTDVESEFMTELMTFIVMSMGEDYDVEELLFYGLDSLPPDLYDKLFDMAYDKVCVDNKGVVFDPNVKGTTGPFKKVCTYVDESSCHDASVWIPSVGLSKPDSLYTEWRSRKFFENTPVKIRKHGKIDLHHYILPDELIGACTLQSPIMHKACNQPVHITEYFGAKPGKTHGTAYYKYDRSTGNCEATPDFCRVMGLGTTTDDAVHDPINDVNLHDCKRSWDGKVEAFIGEQVIGLDLFRMADSCLGIAKNNCCPGGGDGCLHDFDVIDDSKNNDMITWPS